MSLVDSEALVRRLSTMHHQQFNRLLRAVCDIAAIPQWQQVCAHRTLRLRDQMVRLHFEETADVRRLYAYVDLGEGASVDDRMARQLLQLNCTPGAWILGHFGLHGVSGRPLYVASLRTDGEVEDAQPIVDWLGHLVHPLHELAHRHGRPPEVRP
jgi:hypothetical protein